MDESTINEDGTTPSQAKLAATPPRAAFDEADFRVIREFLRSSGGSVLFCLSAVSIFYGLSTIVGPILGTSDALSKTLPSIGTIGLYELSLFGVLAALVLVWRATRDGVSLLVLVGLFLITLGMLVTTVANDNPELVGAVGALVFTLAIAQLTAIRARLGVPIPGLAFAGIGVLIAWNSLNSVAIAYYIGHDASVGRSARELWPVSGWLPVLSGLLLYLSAGDAKTNEYAEAYRTREYFRSPAMVWTVAATVIAGSAVHQYAMMYVFDLPTYVVDYVPLIGISAFTVIEVARAYNVIRAPIAAAIATIPLSTMFVAVESGSYDSRGAFGAGLLASPIATTILLGALCFWSAQRARNRMLGIVGSAYVFCIVLFVLPATGAGGAKRIDENLLWIGASSVAISVLLAYRLPALWAAAMFAATVFAPQSSWFRNVVGYEELSDGLRFATMCGILGAGLLLIDCIFGKALPRLIARAGAALLTLAVLVDLVKHAPFDAPIVLSVVPVVLAAASYWRTRDAVTVGLLALPCARLMYLGVSEAGGWRFMILGFLLLAIGAAWSVHSTTAPAPSGTPPPSENPTAQDAAT